jgi:hypothetical protein
LKLLKHRQQRPYAPASNGVTRVMAATMPPHGMEVHLLGGDVETAGGHHVEGGVGDVYDAGYTKIKENPVPRRAYTLPLMSPLMTMSMTRAIFPQQLREYGNGPPLLFEARRSGRAT